MKNIKVSFLIAATITSLYPAHFVFAGEPGDVNTKAPLASVNTRGASIGVNHSAPEVESDDEGYASDSGYATPSEFPGQRRDGASGVSEAERPQDQFSQLLLKAKTKVMDPRHYQNYRFSIRHRTVEAINQPLPPNTTEILTMYSNPSGPTIFRKRDWNGGKRDIDNDPIANGAYSGLFFNTVASGSSFKEAFTESVLIFNNEPHSTNSVFKSEAVVKLLDQIDKDTKNMKAYVGFELLYKLGQKASDKGTYVVRTSFTVPPGAKITKETESANFYEALLMASARLKKDYQLEVLSNRPEDLLAGLGGSTHSQIQVELDLSDTTKNPNDKDMRTGNAVHALLASSMKIIGRPLQLFPPKKKLKAPLASPQAGAVAGSQPMAAAAKSKTWTSTSGAVYETAADSNPGAASDAAEAVGASAAAAAGASAAAAR